MARNFERNPNVLLVNHVNAEARKQKLGLDTYDADWFVSVIETWLGEHNAVLTGTGVKKLRTRRG